MKIEWTEEETNHESGHVGWKTREDTEEKVRELCSEHPQDWWKDWDYGQFYAIRDRVIARIAAMEEALGPEKVKEIYIRCG